MPFSEALFWVKVADQGTRKPTTYLKLHLAPIQPLLVTPPLRVCIHDSRHDQFRRHRTMVAGENESSGIPDRSQYLSPRILHLRALPHARNRRTHARASSGQPRLRHHTSKAGTSATSVVPTPAFEMICKVPSMAESCSRIPNRPSRPLTASGLKPLPSPAISTRPPVWDHPRDIGRQPVCRTNDGPR